MAANPPPSFSAGTQQSNKRRQRGPLRSMPFILGMMLLIVFITFYQTAHMLNVLSENEDGDAVKSSLNNFVPKNKIKPTRPKYVTTAVKATKAKEDPIPNPSPANGNSTFSSCLLVMDDNHRLVEWMAYHYHVLPLRYLIIAVDPRSLTSPTRILNQWRRLGVYVEEWDDFNFMRADIASHKVEDDAALQIKRDRHRMRQKNFYQACLRQMKKQKRTWVTLIDTDEYLTYNHRGGKDFEQWEQKRLKLHRKQFKGKTRIKPSSVPPTTAEEGAMIKYIRTEQAAGLKFYQSPCISCPRLQFGARESTEAEQKHQVPPSLGVDPERLDTLRFRKHAERQDFVKNGLAKSILDVSRVEKFPRIQTLHRPIKSICSFPWMDEWSSGLRINHYLGSWEAYSYRDDSRRGGERSYEGWAFKAREGEETDDNIQPWVGGFVESHGPEKATELLEGAGLARGMQGNDKNWTIMFLDEILSVNETEGNPIRIAFDNFVRDFHFNKNQSIEERISDSLVSELGWPDGVWAFFAFVPSLS